MTAAEAAQAIIARYGGRGDMCKCPAHDDRDPSLHVNVENGRLLVKCHSGCDQHQVVEALKTDGLWPTNGDGHHLEHSWSIAGPNGKRYEHVRRDTAAGKKLWWRPRLKPHKAADMSLYAVERVPDEAPVVVVTEGEKAADAAWADGTPAVGTVTGAGGCPGDRAIRELLAKAPHQIVLWPDNDAIGKGHMARVHGAIIRICPEAKVAVLEQHLKLRQARVGQRLARDRAPRLAPLAAGRQRPDARLQAVRHDERGVEDEQRRDLGLVGLKLLASTSVSVV